MSFSDFILFFKLWVFQTLFYFLSFDLLIAHLSILNCLNLLILVVKKEVFCTLFCHNKGYIQLLLSCFKIMDYISNILQQDVSILHYQLHTWPWTSPELWEACQWHFTSFVGWKYYLPDSILITTLYSRVISFWKLV